MRNTGQGLMARGYRDACMKQAYQEGYKKGYQEGMASALLRLLTRRFDPLGAPVIERVQAASPAELERWADNCVDGHGLNQVFGDD